MCLKIGDKFNAVFPANNFWNPGNRKVLEDKKRSRKLSGETTDNLPPSTVLSYKILFKVSSVHLALSGIIHNR